MDSEDEASEFAYAAADNAKLCPNASGGGSSTYTSSDKVAQLQVPSAALTESVDCRIN